MSVDEQNNSVADPAPEGRRGTEQTGAPKRLESLLLENSESGVEAAPAVAEWRRSFRFGDVLLLILFCLFFAGVGYLYLGGFSSKMEPASQVSHAASPRFPVPLRSQALSLSAADGGVAVVSPHDPPETAVVEKGTADKVVQSSPEGAGGISLFEVNVGPFLGKDELGQAISDLEELGFQPEQRRGRGLVKMVRLQKGIYPDKEARAQLKKLKQKVKSAFLLPDDGGELAVYAGSFHQEQRARKMQEDLAKKKIDVSLVDNDVVMNGTVLTVLQADQQTAQEVADHIATFGFYTQIEKKK